MTREQLRALLKISIIILETIDESSDGALGGVPESYPYIALTGHINLDQYAAIVQGLKKTKAIEVNYHLMTKGSQFNEVLSKYKELVG